MNPAPAPAFAAPELAAGAAGAPDVAGAGEVALALVIVLVAIFACAWVVKRLRTFGRPASGVLTIVDDLPVGQKERVVLVAAGGTRLLVGVAPGRVSVLHVLGEGELPAELGLPAAGGAGVPSRPAGNRPDFRSLLRRSLGLS